jgi:hypothetical protein
MPCDGMASSSIMAASGRRVMLLFSVTFKRSTTTKSKISEKVKHVITF